MNKIIVVLIFLTLNSCSMASIHTKPIFFSGTFLKIEKSVKVKVCNPKKPDYCLTRTFDSSASSFLIGHKKKKSYIMTSAHVCITDYGNLIHLPGFRADETFYGLTEKMEKHLYFIEAVDKESDLCIVSTKRFKGKPFKIARKNPKRGEKIYNIAAPLGVFEKDLVPLFEGYFTGQAHDRTVLSLPATGGSSGSPVLNEDGKVIGVVSAVMRNFHHVVVSSTLKQIKTIIKSINE